MDDERVRRDQANIIVWSLALKVDIVHAWEESKLWDHLKTADNMFAKTIYIRKSKRDQCGAEQPARIKNATLIEHSSHNEREMALSDGNRWQGL